MAQPLIGAEAEVPSNAIVAILLALALVIACQTGCGTGSVAENGFPNPSPLPLILTVNPSSITVPVGSTTTFTASPGPPSGFSLVWSVSPSSGGTITNSGVYTASETAASYAVIATWVPTNPSVGNRITGSAMVTVLRPVGLNVDLTEASGAIATSGPIQNAAIVGENLSAVTSTDPTGKTQARSGFPIPVPCARTDPSCH